MGGKTAEILKNIDDLFIDYWKNRDIEKTMRIFEEDSVLIGLVDTYEGKKSIREHFEEERVKYPGEIKVGEYQFDVEHLVNEYYTVTGFSEATDPRRRELMKEFFMKFSAICRFDDNGCIVEKLHVSMPARDIKEYYDIHAEEILHKRDNYEVFMKNIPGGVLRCENSVLGKVLEYNDGFFQMIGYSRTEMKEKFDNCLLNILHPDDKENAFQTITQQLEEGDYTRLEFRIIHKDGTIKHIYEEGHLVKTNNEASRYLVLTDVTELRSVMRALDHSIQRHEIIMNISNDIIFEYDLDDNKIGFSNNWEKKFGYKPYSRNVVDTSIGPNRHLTGDIDRIMGIVKRMNREKVAIVDEELQMMRSDGSYVWCKVKATLQYNKEGKTRKAIGVIIDIDEEKKRQEELSEKAKRDSLTGLLNKGATDELISEYISAMENKHKAALFVIDIDNFKSVNDNFGHARGDELLSSIAYGFRKIFRRDDVVGRIGGDEFTVLMKDIPSIETVISKAQDTLNLVYEISHSGDLDISCSIGIAIAPDHGTNYATLFEEADHAMYKVKKKAKNAYRICEA
ncbi:MAG: diguanylate cyclase domain-containing protein [Suipraeoptans sp.]